MIMKGIRCCGDCGYYNWKKHKCTRATDEGDNTSSFYADCPLPDVVPAQEARVVKISELTAGEPMLVWLEDIDKEETVAGMIFDYVPGRFGFKLTDLASMDRIYPRIEDYLTRWRCWTSRPTAEQMEAEPWE